MSEHAHKGTSIWREKRERELMSGHAQKGTRDWKVKRGLKYTQNMSTIATKKTTKQNKTKKFNS